MRRIHLQVQVRHPAQGKRFRIQTEIRLKPRPKNRLCGQRLRDENAQRGHSRLRRRNDERNILRERKSKC
jgi:hypothetical protein